MDSPVSSFLGASFTPGIELDADSPPWYNPAVPIGAVAQLGEHHAGSVRVRGSNPLCSIPHISGTTCMPSGSVPGVRHALTLMSALLVGILAVPAFTQQRNPTGNSASAPAAPPAPPSPPASTPEVAFQITIISRGTGRDEIAVGYGKPTKAAEAKGEMQALAETLGSTVEGLKVTTDAGITVAEAKLTGLTNWKTGQVNLDVLNQAFRRARFFRIVCFFFGPFPIRAPATWVQGPLRIQTQTQEFTPAQGAVGRIVDYQIWVDQSRGIPARLPTVYTRTQKPGVPWLLVAVAVVAVGCGVFAIVYIVVAARRRGTN